MLSKYTCRLLLTTSLAVLAVPAVSAQEANDVDTARQDTIVIRGEFIPDPQRETSQVATFLSADDLARTGDSNAALALTRLSGLSIVSDKFAFVRGLGDRYSASMLNGSQLPSPEPLRRTVPLDLFPSNILEGASVEKTFSVSAPGEFGGGLINLKTISRPSENFTTLKFGVSGDTVTTAEKGYFVSGSDSDWTGYDDGLREIPSALQTVLSSDQRLEEFSDSEIETVGESLVNSPLSVIQNGKLGPNYEGSISLGRNYELGSVGIGFVGVAGYDQEWTTKDITRQFVQGGVLGSEINTLETAMDVTTNALGSLTFDWDMSQVAATLFYVHSTTKEAQIDTGSDFNAPGTGIVFDESTGWYERELTFFQLRGEHEIDNFQFNWRGALSESSRDAPYERSVRRLYGDDGVPRYSLANANSINFSYLQDELGSFGSDLIYTVDFDGDRQMQLSGGFDYSSTERDYEFYGFRFAGGNSLPDDVEEARTDYLFSPDNINNARFVLQELPSTTDSYKASLDVSAAYVEAEVDLTNFIQTTLGVRYEEAEQTVGTFDRFGNPGTGDVNLENEYLLPSALINWNFADDLQLRLGYSQTIARPQFRELARASYTDPDTDRVYRGSDGLIDSELTNYDARLEYYFGRNQFVSIAGFYKEILNPIEEVQFSTSTFVFETTFINSPKAELLGGELEYRTQFDMPIPGQWFADRNWMFSSNYTYTQSEVQAEAGETLYDPISRTVVSASNFALDGAKLQGTPEHILNLQFGWEGPNDQLTLLAGWVDERILQRGLSNAGNTVPDIVEDPGIQLDLVYKHDVEIVGRDFTFSLSARNLLDEEHKEFQVSEGDVGETDFYTYDRGTSISASVTAKF
ncbi:TonB-dependent receptor domain-containing protein [Hirschia baltica]|uniref:TonB-dependent receptor n=1 Tax=Hirschia baltica (strain ATCC 49814 / DSM 5838 / IFAM 1418) TaxID=582402 RepID=C6XJ45_HIRBI|nr:TonB-dependent receptor [Hirschia baltica]ACT59140.1 TonB-dependent receptor [Hirschia baltica ATCC 49814]